MMGPQKTLNCPRVLIRTAEETSEALFWGIVLKRVRSFSAFIIKIDSFTEDLLQRGRSLIVLLMGLVMFRSRLKIFTFKAKTLQESEG